MDKETKKKVAGGAAAVTAAAGAVVAGAASVLSQDNENVEAVSEGAPIAEGEELADGGSLPEVEVLGNTPIQDGGELPETTVTGHAHVAETQQAASSQAPAPDDTEVAQQGTSIEDDNQNDVTNIPQEAVEEEEHDAPSFAFDPDEEPDAPSFAFNPDEEPGLLAQLEEKAEELGAKIFGDSSETEQSSMSDHMNSMDVTGFN